MNQLIVIGKQQIAIKEYQGQRVVTLKDIDTVHERPEGTAARNFRNNKNRLQDGRDYFIVCVDEIRRDRIMDVSDALRSKITLITERGYLMLVKSFTDDLAWEVQGQLVDNYFNKPKQPMSTMDQIQIIALGTAELNDRVDKLENTMVIDYGQQRVLERLVSGVVITSLGGKDSNAYKEVGKKVFSECNHDIKDYFNVNSRNNVPRAKYEDACKYIKTWQPSTNTKLLIDQCNAQISM